MGMSASGLSPERVIISRAMSTIRTGVPILRRKISPPFPIAPACMISPLASGMVIKYRVASGCVTVTGPPLAIWSLNKGTTLPELPITLPKRTAMYIPRCEDAYAWVSISMTLLEAPITLVGRTALSVDTITHLSTLNLWHRSSIDRVPIMLLKIASQGWCSIRGTCLYAAA